MALACGAWTARAGAAPAASPNQVRVVTDASGSRLQVDGRNFLVRGMNWDYIPIGQNYAFDLWSQPEDVIVAALEREMGLMRSMGVNAIRVYAGMPPRWVKYVHERFGIWVMLNHPCGRYGFTLDGAWIPSVDYSDPKMREAIRNDVIATFTPYVGTPGVLMWLLGNENNYGLSWSSFEIEALPKGERDTARAKHLYSLFGEIVAATKALDPSRPVAIANGDLQYVDLIASEVKGLDILGTNVYRGISVRDMYEVTRAKLGIPLMYTEFGCDAFHAKQDREDPVMQAHYLRGQWREICEQAAGQGGVGNAIGGFVFQWSDGWWKYGQDSRLDVHDTHASWPNGGFPEDFVEGDNNMNEEWWGICAKGPADGRSLYELYPRAAYYVLQQAFALDPYVSGVDRAAIARHFDAIDPVDADLRARGARATAQSALASRVRVSGLRLDLQTVSTGGTRVTTPPASAPQTALPQFRGYDKLQSFTLDVEGRASDNVTGMLSLNVLGHVPTNPINEIFYEKRGRVRNVNGEGTSFDLAGNERVKAYKASVSWDERWFTLDGFYRTGHYHWGYEGDFFGLYREANYGLNTDIYDADAPVGFEITGKRRLQGLKFAYGQELWWGANPAVIAKYRRTFGRVTATGVVQEDVATQSNVTSSSAVPTPRTSKATLALEHARGPFALTVGGIWSGRNKVGRSFLFTEDVGGETVVKQDEIFRSDALGAKAKLTYQRGRVNAYLQTARMGLVADAGPTAALTFTNWSLRDVGTGNQTNLMGGVLVNQGPWQIGPNLLWQKPIVGPIPAGVPAPGIPRNVLDDPFAVRANRELFGAELMIGWDPTPASWMWAWDNDVREDARFAASLDFVYRHMPTTQDVSIGVLADGRTTFAFPSATPARDLWEVRARAVSRLGPSRRLVATAFVGDAEPNGDDDRRVTRWGADARFAWETFAVTGSAHFDDWGPYDYHRDFNLTFPVQLSGEIAKTLGAPRWFSQPQTSLGVRGMWRSLDGFSPRYAPDPGSDARGSEWEFRSFLLFAL